MLKRFEVSRCRRKYSGENQVGLGGDESLADHVAQRVRGLRGKREPSGNFEYARITAHGMGLPLKGVLGEFARNRKRKARTSRNAGVTLR